ncbi:AAA family ATPase [uncultured Sulfitobacter sp.]|uniref:ATP-dependent nuclease n=1 Tax=uncultured Sulfitobacter sp. TaxID=191468 RepID=UPI002604C380|nr:AAA family ATPase [uncultured Sulfitobacter sp.]
MKIRTLKVEKFRAVRHSEIELSQETAFVGQNSAGKSSLLRALNAFFNFPEEKRAFVEGRHAFHKTTTATITIGFSNVPEDCDLPRQTIGGEEIRARLKYRKSDVWQICDNGTWVTAPGDMHQKLSEHIRYVYIPMRRDHEVSGWSDTGLLKSVVSAWLEQHTQNRDTISPKVTEVSTAIQRQAFKKLSKQIRRVTPLNGKFSFSLEYDPAPNYSLFLQDLVLRVSEGDTTVDLQDCGSGTQSMTAFGLYSYLAELQGNTYVLGIEEPEQNLHPHAQRELLQNLRKLPLQVLFTTHSTVMVDELDHEEVVLCRRTSSTTRGVEVTTTQIKSAFWAGQGFDRERYYLFHRQRNSDFFFANHIVLVESPIDGEVIKYILSEEGIDQSAFAVSIYSVGGVKSLPYAFMLLRELGMSFSIVVDKDYFMPYLNNERKQSLNPAGFPKYRKELKGDSLLNIMLPDPADQADLLEKFHSNHSRAMEVLDAIGVYCFRWAMEIDLVASNTAEGLIYHQLNIPPGQQNTLELLSNRGKSLKRLETVLSVLRQLPKRNYPHSYARIRKSLPKVIKQAI